ncbi:MAG TPA: HD domain-containing protein [Verrucomicrobiae bacterium]|nr:HD domain-containing protein [Verrucomicrobiae bacterium]
MNRDIDFLFELGQLRYIKRAWVQVLCPDFENLSEHMFRVIWLALLISKMENAGDHEKIMKMALAHDIVESRTGDVHYISRQYTKRNEELAIADMVEDTSLTEFKDIWNEYEKRESIEAKIVKDADNLSVDMELVEQAYRGNQLKEVFSEHRHKVASSGLTTESAKKLWHQIWNGNPHDWHLKGRNRFNGGDWKEYK